jgi:hypothetical protein
MNANYNPTDPDGAEHTAPRSSEGANGRHNNNFAQVHGSIPFDDAIAFDLLENPSNWPDNPAIQHDLAELLEIHLAMQAHAEDLETALAQTKGIKWFASSWLMAAAAIAFAVLPVGYALSRVRENSRMQARGAELEIELQKRLQARLWSDFFSDSLNLLKQIKSPAKYCAPAQEDRSGEVELAKKLYAIGRSLSFDSLDDPELIEAGRNMQNWLTEVSANDSCMTRERSHELLVLAQMMDLESRTSRLSHRLREVES